MFLYIEFLITIICTKSKISNYFHWLTLMSLFESLKSLDTPRSLSLSLSTLSLFFLYSSPLILHFHFILSSHGYLHTLNEMGKIPLFIMWPVLRGRMLCLVLGLVCAIKSILCVLYPNIDAGLHNLTSSWLFIVCKIDRQ